MNSTRLQRRLWLNAIPEFACALAFIHPWPGKHARLDPAIAPGAGAVQFPRQLNSVTEATASAAEADWLNLGSIPSHSARPTGHRVGPPGQRHAGTATWITTTFGYNNLGQLLTTTWPLTSGVFATASQAYDALGRVVTQTDELGRLTVTRYDALGRPVTAWANYVDGVFDPAFRDEDLVTVTTYDAAGNRVLVTDPKGIQTRFGYDLLGRLVMVVENDGGFGGQAAITTTYSYDAAGNLLTISDGRGKVSTFTYDLLGRQVTASDPLAHTTVYTYNAAGSQTALLYANGQETAYTYDRLGRMTAIDYPAGTPDVEFEYDLLGQRTAMTDGTGNTTWGYDLAGRPVTITQAGIGAPVVYTYNSAGRRTALLYPGAQTAGYQYDLAGRLVRVTDWAAQTTAYTYDVAGQLLASALPNGISTSYGYDAAYRLSTISHQDRLAVLGAYTYTVDAAGQRVGVTEALAVPDQSGGEPPPAYATRHSVASGSVAAGGSRGSVTGFVGGGAGLAFTHSGLGGTTTVGTTLETQAIGYTYDAMYRLTAAEYADGSYFHYAYDAVGNRTSEVACWGSGSCTPITTTYAYDDANRLISVDAVAYTWDANGNLLSDGTFTYTYDAANRLIAATNGITVSGYSYNGLGDRVNQTVAGVVTTYTLDLAAGLTQVLADGSFTYLYGQGRIAQYDGVDFDYFLGDALGSVRQLADESGEVTLARRYEPYGDVLESTGTGTTSFGFTGEDFDAVTGLIYLRARFMQPSLGRFITRDSFSGFPEHPGSLNRFAYVQGDPIRWVDSSGQYRWLNTSSPEHRDIEDFLARTHGYWNVHVEYKIGTGRTGTLRVDLLFFPDVSDYYSAFNPGLTLAEVYEIEPYCGPESVTLAQSEAEDKYVSGLKTRTSSLTGVIRGDLSTGTYDWRRVIWIVGDDPLPAQPTLIRKSDGNGQLLVWFEDDGAIMFIDSTWDDSRLRKTPRIMFDWLQEHKQDSLANQQFAEMVANAKYGIPVGNWPGVRVPSEEQARIAGGLAYGAALGSACYLIVRILPLLLLVP